jgi:hypothetical protein
MKRRTRIGLITTAVLGVGAATALAAAPLPSQTFEGKTAQHIADNAVELKTDANGHVSKFTIGWRAPCQKKGVFWTATTRVKGGSAGLPMQGDSFHTSGSYMSPAGNHIKGKVTVSLHGQFTDETHASGTWKPKVVVYKKQQKIDTCKAKAINWTATAVE